MFILNSDSSHDYSFESHHIGLLVVVFSGAFQIYCLNYIRCLPGDTFDNFIQNESPHTVMFIMSAIITIEYNAAPKSASPWQCDTKNGDVLHKE